MIPGKPSLVFRSLLACAGLLLSRPLVAAQTQAPRYVGSDACVACHDDAAGKIADSAHGKLAENSVPAKKGCEGCHGPGSNHVNSGGDTSLLFRFKGGSAAAIRRQCAACHESAAASVHSHRSTTCLSCHAAHHYREKKFLLIEAPPQLCTTCHDQR